jgi:glucan phosphoethanolaminetransferase (alkaline phosphatase superfamily)
LSKRDNLLPCAMLGIMDVQTRVYDGALDLFKPCRANGQATHHAD